MRRKRMEEEEGSKWSHVQTSFRSTTSENFEDFFPGGLEVGDPSGASAVPIGSFEGEGFRVMDDDEAVVVLTDQ
jgi:hypothetical protein